MRLAITGATGLLGSALLDALARDKPDWEIFALTRKRPVTLNFGVWNQLDITNLEQVRTVITKINPDAVIHLAAFARPDQCQEKPEETFRVNFLGARNIALACDRFDTELLHLSTDQVFYGNDPDRTHDEREVPVAGNVYGDAKILAEQHIQAHLRRYWIVRTGKIFGGPNDTVSFPNTALNAFRNAQKLTVATDWAAHMTHGSFLSEALIKLMEKKTYGIYHIASPGVPSYFEIAQALADKMAAPRSLIVPGALKDLKFAAKRARVELSLKLWGYDFGQGLPDWKKGLDLFASERNRSFVH
ncbi:MAG: NAD(P)-dependent oxidoreductase [Elusimicrobia bacterium]|nr:NAD(P)-dependent oxidoreductase [Elusimicrobiota bacterium]